MSAQNEPNPSDGCKEALAVKTSAASAVDGISAAIKLGPGCTYVCPLVVETDKDGRSCLDISFFNESRFEALR